MLSVIILAKNEADRLERCLGSLPERAQILVVDDQSVDETAALARSLGAQVYSRPLDDFSSQKNFGLAKATGDWLLFLDADEYLTPALKKEVEVVLAKPPAVAGFYLRRRTVFMGKALRWGELGEQRQLRLVSRASSPRWQRAVHEVLAISGPTAVLAGVLWHEPHRSLTHFVSKINHYTDLEVRQAGQVGVKGWSLVGYPAAKFLLNYFLRLGFLDGYQGLIIAVLMSYYSFLKRAKIWERQKGYV